MDATLDTLPDDMDALKAIIRRQQVERRLFVAQRDAVVAERDTIVTQHDAVVAQHAAVIVEHRDLIDRLKRDNDALTHRLAQLLRRLYGPRSERIDAHQLLLFGQAMASPPPEAPPPDTCESSSQDAAGKPGGRRPGHGRRPLPDDLPRQRIEHPLDPAELTCPCCGEERRRIGEMVSEQLEYVPASLFVLQHVRGKYACKHCEESGVAVAERSSEGQVIEKGLPGPGLVAQVAVSKFCEHLPLYRLERIFTRCGVTIPRSTMCGWLREAAKLLTPLHNLMAQRIRQSRVIHTDDTPLPVQDKGRGRTKTGRLWVYLGDGTHPYVVYDYTPSRSRDGPAKWLDAYQGYLQADAFGGYDGIYAAGGVTEAACWAHVRRKFHDARLSDPARALHVLAQIRLLYDVEKQAKDREPAERVAMRQDHAQPILASLYDWLIDERQRTLPKSPMGQAIGYALNQWDALVRYVDDGDLAIDNNAAERAIRPLAIGRKNYLFAGSDAGGHTAAVLYSLIASAQRHDLDPFAYLRDVLARIAPTPISQIEQFLPDHWQSDIKSNAGN